MKKFKFACAILLCAALTASMAGCTKEEKKEEETTTSATTSATTTEEETTTETAAVTEGDETSTTATEWICETCGAFGNTGKFCSECGAQAPDSFIENGYVDVTENTAPIPTLMTYETETETYDSKGANEVTFGTQNPVPFKDPATGLDLEVQYHGKIYYDLDDGAEAYGEDVIKARVIDSGVVRFMTTLEYCSYSNIDAYLDIVEEGIAYDLRQNLTIHNVTVEVESVTLTETAQAAYDEATAD